MADSPTALIAGIQQKIAMLAESRDQALSRCEMLSSRIEELESDLDESRESLRKANLEIEFLTLSHRLADSPEAIVNARKTISRIIRRIDAAIALIKSDPADL